MQKFYILDWGDCDTGEQSYQRDDTLDGLMEPCREVFLAYNNKPHYFKDESTWQLHKGLLRKMMCDIEENWSESAFYGYPFTKSEFLKMWKHVYDNCALWDGCRFRMKWCD